MNLYRHNRRRSSNLIDAVSGQDFIAKAPAELIFCAQTARSAEPYGKRIIRTPRTHRPVVILATEYPVEVARFRPRRELSDLVHRM